MTEQTFQPTQIGAITLSTADRDVAKAFDERFLQSELPKHIVVVVQN